MRFLPGSLLSAIVVLSLVFGLGLMAQLDRKKALILMTLKLS